MVGPTGSAYPPGDFASPLAPTPMYPERPGTQYERKFSPAAPMQRGPLRFEEGVATDTDIPVDFQTGVVQGYVTAPGRINANAKVDTKWPEETVRQRAHVGSAAWVEGPSFLNEFAHGSFTQQHERRYEQVVRDGQHYHRANAAVVWD